MTACWSECVVGGQESRPPFAAHGNGKFQYGPTVRHELPPLVVSYTSSRPTYTWLASAGSTARNWLYQVCTPGAYPRLACSAESLPASLLHSATLFHGPPGVPPGTANTPIRFVPPWLAFGLLNSALDPTSESSTEPSPEYASVVRPICASLMAPVAVVRANVAPPSVET